MASSMFPRETPPLRKLSDSTFDMASVQMMAVNALIFMVVGDDVWMCGKLEGENDDGRNYVIPGDEAKRWISTRDPNPF